MRQHRKIDRGVTTTITRKQLREQQSGLGNFTRAATRAALNAPILRLTSDEQRLHNRMHARRQRLANERT